MDRTNLTQSFAKRLQQALINAGYGSSRSITAVDINKFSKLMGHSVQICRKYLNGKIVPDITKLSILAEKLNVSPGWLLFGDCHAQQSLEPNKITINKSLLHYIFSHANALYNNASMQDNLPDLLIELTHNISQINVDDEKSMQIVDLALKACLQIN